MEILAINKEYIEKYIEVRSREEKADKQAFLFLMEEKKKSSDLKVINGIAKIEITGVLGNSWYFDTQYNSIIEKTIEAESRDDVDEIQYIIDSPGGLVSGAEEAARAIAKTTKHTKAIVKNIAASAGYWLASQADKIVVSNESAQVGSIGVMAVFYDFSKWEKKEGIEKIKIISSNAPDKNLDVTTERGFKKYQAELDKLHDIFAKNVANGRKTDIIDVNENFGAGAVLFAVEAKEVGMIDEINLKIDGLNDNNEKEIKMAKGNEEKLFSQAEVDEIVAAAKVTAKAEGMAEGVTAEKNRVEKHLTYLGKAKDETILENVKAGKDFSDCVEKYADEKYGKEEIQARIDENPEPNKENGPRGGDPEKETPEAAHKRLFGK